LAVKNLAHLHISSFYFSKDLTMTYSPSKIAARRLAQTAVFLLLPIAALAQTAADPGYLHDSQGNKVLSGTPGQCWHTGEWTPAMAQPACDPVLRSVAVVVVQAPTPKPVAPSPVPVAATKDVLVVVAPLPVQTMRYGADALFGFDKAVISLAGKKVLDEASASILGLESAKVEVVGHADHIGSATYNQKLSLQRAEAVRDYLAVKGVPAKQITTRGVGETEPVTQTGACVGGSSLQVIACLQPDRHVEVNVQGIKAVMP
jgi:OOP family OmpA-OmpF porin